MGSVYNRIAGSSAGRLCALSDGVFAIAMTLLVLDLHVPQIAANAQSEHAAIIALRALGPRLLTYFMSFLTLGIFWVGQQTQLNVLERSNRNLTWLHMTFLLFVTLVPFTTSFLAAFITVRVALIVYWLNILLMGAGLYATWKYAAKAQLQSAEVDAQMHAAALRRIFAAQALYAFGALLCIVNTYVSIAFIVLVQLNYAIAPRLRWLYGL